MAQDMDNDKFLEELNSQLIKQKKEMDPFAGKEVEIDVESLGLDDLSKKEVPTPEVPKSLPENLPTPKNLKDSSNKEKKEINTKDIKKDNVDKDDSADKSKINDKIITNQDLKKANSNKPDNKSKSPPKVEMPKDQSDIKDDENSTVSAVKNLLDKIKKSAILNSIEEVTNKIIAKEDDEDIKEDVKEDVKVKNDEIKNEDSAVDKEMELLRQKYVLPLQDGSEYKDLSSSYARPVTKNLNQYIKDEAPALPILSRFRTNDNLHIPLIPTPQERINNLFNAIDSQNVRYFNSSYKYVQNPNVISMRGETLLTYAIMSRNYPILASILSKGADPNRPNKLGYNPIIITIETKDFRAFYMLLENGANINYEDKFGRNYLMYAARVGFLPAVEYLIDRGIDINSQDKNGFTPLAIASKNNRALVAKYLSKNGARAWSDNFNIDDSESVPVKDLRIMRDLQGKWQKK